MNSAGLAAKLPIPAATTTRLEVNDSPSFRLILNPFSSVVNIPYALLLQIRYDLALVPMTILDKSVKWNRLLTWLPFLAAIPVKRELSAWDRQCGKHPNSTADTFPQACDFPRTS